MKAVRIIAILGLLVIFPAISYLYLIRGYNFRLEALQQLEPKVEITSFDFEPIASLADIQNHASILYDADAGNSESMLRPIFEEFSHRDEFQLLGFTEDSLRSASFASEGQWKMIPSKYPYEMNLALVDTGAVIRNYYMLDSMSFTSLGQHIPIILPRVKEQDIVLKRENEK